MTFKPYKNAKELGIDLSRKFVVVEENGNSVVSNGDILEINEDDDSYSPPFNNLTTGKRKISCSWSRLEYADNKLNKNIMSNTMEKFKKLFIKEPLKTFIEVGIKNEDNTLTDDGIKVLLNVLATDNEEKLIEIANKLKEE